MVENSYGPHNLQILFLARD